MKRLCLVLVLVALVGCAGEDREGAKRALTALSLTNIVIEPATHPWSIYTSKCGKDDGIQHAFTAKNLAGATVNGVVCCSSWGSKGCTVRF